MAADPGKPGKKLVRYGTAPETVEELARAAAAALANPSIGIHGVSACYRNPVRHQPSSPPWQNTSSSIRPWAEGTTPYELPYPVTQEVADTFNRIFGRN